MKFSNAVLVLLALTNTNCAGAWKSIMDGDCIRLESTSSSWEVYKQTLSDLELTEYLTAAFDSIAAVPYVGDVTSTGFSVYSGIYGTTASVYLTRVLYTRVDGFVHTCIQN